MKILIFGITGLIGNGIFVYLAKKNYLNVFGTFRDKKNILNDHNQINFDIHQIINNSELENIFKKIKPDYVINCIGITKHKIESFDKKYIYRINSEFPRTLKNMSNKYKCKLVQISTDCVFLGDKGNYNERYTPDAKDLYAISKINGEFNDNKHLTIRTSTVGHELETSYGLMEWFLKQESECDGYSNAFFSGITTTELAEIIFNFVIKDDLLNGLVHISSNRISKFNLLKTFRTHFDKEIKINEYSNFFIDRSLDNSKFKRITGYVEKTWAEMLMELSKSSSNYN